ncbi:MAG: hypothetical protein D8M58_06260 [Calditrichaeota bacterium]|nr:MAG: hypothetical protein DWQ03_20245 [Calditrichota bacterium]MBL1204983.1 hypothetical protein [Calditrichota bacterium]NOG44813.1 hypothetical protein [Calditrichota bacterium]
MHKLLLLLLLFSISLYAQSAQEVENTFGVKFSGFIKTDVMFDSRQTVSAREGHFLLYPAGEMPDANGDDINAKPNLNMLSIQTRLKAGITGPNAFGAKTSGVIEGAFFGHSNSDINGFRLRHAFIKLSWQKSSLLIGQTWHPMFITEVFPGVVSFNTGVPFQPFSRNPQIRYTKNVNHISISFTAASQRDFASTGPNGGTSSYLRNSSIPIINTTVKYKTDNVVLGAGLNYMTIMPRLFTSNDYGADPLTKYDADETVSSLAGIAFAKFVSGEFTIKAESIYGSNMTDLLMLGGYAVKSTDLATGAEEYTNSKTLSAWTDLSYGKGFGFGLFAGYTNNMGTEDENTGPYYSRGSNIDNVIRVSPRLQYQIGKTRFAGEVEYTSAAYGTADINGKVKDTTNTDNIRLVIAAYLFF